LRGDGFRLRAAVALFRRVPEPKQCGAGGLAFPALGREQVPRPTHRLDDSRLAGVGLDLAPDPRDADVDRPIERLVVARARQIQEALARQDAQRVLGEGFQETELGRGQRVDAVLVIAQMMGVEVEPFRAEADTPVLLARRRRLGLRTSAQDGAPRSGA
jgi:hypothetical protein